MLGLILQAVQVLWQVWGQNKFKISNSKLVFLKIKPPNLISVKILTKIEKNSLGLSLRIIAGKKVNIISIRKQKR